MTRNDSGERGLPAFDEGNPIHALSEVTAEPVFGGWRWFEWLADQLHIGIFGSSATLSSVTSGTSGNEVLPAMLSAKPAGNNMVNGQEPHLVVAILARVVVAA
jgi:hypothetical protein